MAIIGYQGNVTIPVANKTIAAKIFSATFNHGFHVHDNAGFGDSAEANAAGVEYFNGSVMIRLQADADVVKALRTQGSITIQASNGFKYASNGVIFHAVSPGNLQQSGGVVEVRLDFVLANGQSVTIG